jgi:zinc and cadmium transporter
MLLLVIYTLLIVVASMVGGWLPTRLRLTHLRLQTTISFVGGLMLGVAIWQMLPHAVVELGADRAHVIGTSMMLGMATMFLLLRVFQFHHHDTTGVETQPVHHHDHDHDCDSHGPTLAANRMSGLGVFLGLAIHTLIDGIALAACVDSASKSSAASATACLGTFLAILLHKPLDAVSITSLMTAGGWSPRGRTLVNLAFSLMCPIGAMIYHLGAGALPLDSRLVTGATLAFSAGVFLCISLSDLLPEIEFHTHNRLGLTIALLAGVLLSYGISLIEPLHVH